MKKYVIPALIGVIGITLFPLTPFFLDQCLCLSISGSIVLFAVSLYVKDMTSMTSYPALLLYLTIARIGLNLSSTRLILSRGEGGMVIPALGKFMSSGSILAGVSIFFLIFIVNLILISKGSERTAEIRARFALESLPGNQMSIDAEILSGKISLYEASKRRKRLREESDFYSCMEGAFKFIKGDALISIVVVVINVIGLFFKGVFFSSAEFSWEKMSFLIIGDGIVGQIPLIFTSMGGATLVSRVGRKVSLSEDIVNQIGLFSDLFKLGAGAALVMLLIPGMPALPLLSVSGLFLYLGFKRDKDPFIFSEVGHLLLKINEQSSSIRKDLQEAYLSVCKTLKKNRGISMPKLTIGTASNISVKDWDIFVSGKRVIGGSFSYESELVRSFESLIYSLSHEVISSEYVESLLNDLREVNGWLTDELIPKKISRDCLTLVLRSLVKEQVSLDLFPGVVEALILYSGKHEPEEIVEYVRKRLGSLIGESVLKGYKVVRAVTLESSVEKMIEASNVLNPLIVQKILDEVDSIFKHSEYDEDAKDVIVTGASVRCAVRKIIESRFPEVPVLAYGEMAGSVALKALTPVSDQVLISCGSTLKNNMSSLIRTQQGED